MPEAFNQPEASGDQSLDAWRRMYAAHGLNSMAYVALALHIQTCMPLASVTPERLNDLYASIAAGFTEPLYYDEDDLMADLYAREGTLSLGALSAGLFTHGQLDFLTCLRGALERKPCEEEAWLVGDARDSIESMDEERRRQEDRLAEQFRKMSVRKMRDLMARCLNVKPNDLAGDN